MESTLNAPNILDSIQVAMKAQTAEWVEVCNRFCKWERQEVMLVDPSPQTQACHRRSLEFLLKGTESMLALVSEPNFVYPELQDDLKEIHIRLKESWSIIYNPMSEEEARQILAKAFPE